MNVDKLMSKVSRVEIGRVWADGLKQLRSSQLISLFFPDQIEAFSHESK